jgi:hypothetical protein
MTGRLLGLLFEVGCESWMNSASLCGLLLKGYCVRALDFRLVVLYIDQDFECPVIMDWWFDDVRVPLGSSESVYLIVFDGDR